MTGWGLDFCRIAEQRWGPNQIHNSGKYFISGIIAIAIPVLLPGILYYVVWTFILLSFRVYPRTLEMNLNSDRHQFHCIARYQTAHFALCVLRAEAGALSHRKEAFTGKP